MAFTPGKVTNTEGGPKEKPFHDALQVEIKASTNLRGLRVTARKLLDLAVGGDIQAIKEVANRLESMPVQQIDQTIYKTRTVIRAPAPEASPDFK